MLYLRPVAGQVRPRMRKKVWSEAINRCTQRLASQPFQLFLAMVFEGQDEGLSTVAKVLCKPHFEKPHLVMGRCETGKSKSAWIGPYSKYQKYIHDRPATRHVDKLLKFGIGADSSTFGLTHFETPLFKISKAYPWWVVSRTWPIMWILLLFGIGANSSTFGLPRFAMPHYEMGVFKMGKIKTGFAENLGHRVRKIS